MTGATVLGKENSLLEIFRSLDREHQQSLVDFAEFLQSRHSQKSTAEFPEYVAIERPEKETVVAAIKRLSASYPMLQRSAMIHETADLMTAHMMKGRGAIEVIDDLEAVFEKHYQNFKDRGV